jgi:hypothetical protein
MMPPWKRFKADHFLIYVIDPLLVKVFSEGKNHALRLNVHLDNCLVHSSNAAKEYADDNSLIAVPDLTYNSNLAPSDFWLFGHITICLANHVCNDIAALLEAVIEVLNEIRLSDL